MSVDPEPVEEISKASEEVSSPTPRRIVYRTLTVLWCFPTLGALWILLSGSGARRGAAGLDRVRLEDWISMALIAIHGFWIWRWRRWRDDPR